MPRAPSTADVYHAIAEPRRRQILDLLAAMGPVAVGVIVASLGLPQPTVSKHLGVLRVVGLVSVERQGQSRVYQLKAQELRAVYTWAGSFERFWTHKLDRIKHRAEARAREQGHPPAIAAAAARKDRPS